MNTNNYTDEKALREMTSSANGKNPFLVPEGYFDNLPDRVMSHIREDGQHSLLKRRHKSRFFIRLTAAAVLTGFFSLAGLMIYEQRHPLSNQQEGSPLTSLQEIEYTDELLDYAMLDNNDIEYYLTEAE
ncbi:MAG: hypothetical protein J6S07_01730 [Bacteroidaceae bacterium]|nr:hypothetical protein [Bacteroidaceae bacterium]